MAETNRLNLTSDIATAIGVVSLILMVSVGISFFIKTNQYKLDTNPLENDKFELNYGVYSIFQDKLMKFQSTYNRRLSISIFLFITSFLPLMLVSMFHNGSEIVLMMVIVLIIMIVVGLSILVPASTRHDAYNHILKDWSAETEKSRRTKRAQKLAAFYWPLLTAIFLGWSLWTMNWGTTWIVFPVGAILFVSLIGLMELLDKGHD